MWLYMIDNSINKYVRFHWNLIVYGKCSLGFELVDWVCDLIYTWIYNAENIPVWKKCLETHIAIYPVM